MVEATALSALDGVTGPKGGAWDAGIVLTEVRFPTVLNVRGNASDAAFCGGMEAALGVVPPAAPNSVAVREELAVLWLAPDEWLLIATGGAEGVEGALEDKLSGVFATVVDLSDNYVCIRIEGANARRVLQKGWTLDLHPRAFGIGQCAQSMLAHAPVILRQISDAPGYELMVRPSFAKYTWDWLVDASAEYGHRVE
jgi:sarcosine oxidase subunit gamma